SPGTVRRMLERARADDTVGAVGSYMKDERGVPWFAAGELPSVPREAVDKVKDLFRAQIGRGRAVESIEVESTVGWITGAALLVRRSALGGEPFFDERIFLYFDDKDLGKRLRDRGLKIVVPPGTSGMHVGGSSTRKAAEKSAIAYRESQLW